MDGRVNNIESSEELSPKYFYGPCCFGNTWMNDCYSHEGMSPQTISKVLNSLDDVPDYLRASANGVEKFSNRKSINFWNVETKFMIKPNIMRKSESSPRISAYEDVSDEWNERKTYDCDNQIEDEDVYIQWSEKKRNYFNSNNQVVNGGLLSKKTNADDELLSKSHTLFDAEVEKVLREIIDRLSMNDSSCISPAIKRSTDASDVRRNKRFKSISHDANPDNSLPFSRSEIKVKNSFTDRTILKSKMICRACRHSDQERNETINCYRYYTKAFKAMRPGLKISADIKESLNKIIESALKKLAETAAIVMRESNKRTLLARDLRVAIKACFPTEMAKVALENADGNLQKYSSYNTRRNH